MRVIKLRLPKFQHKVPPVIQFPWNRVLPFQRRIKSYPHSLDKLKTMPNFRTPSSIWITHILYGAALARPIPSDRRNQSDCVRPLGCNVFLDLQNLNPVFKSPNWNPNFKSPNWNPNWNWKHTRRELKVPLCHFNNRVLESSLENWEKSRPGTKSWVNSKTGIEDWIL